MDLKESTSFFVNFAKPYDNCNSNFISRQRDDVSCREYSINIHFSVYLWHFDDFYIFIVGDTVIYCLAQRPHSSLLQYHSLYISLSHIRQHCYSVFLCFFFCWNYQKKEHLFAYWISQRIKTIKTPILRKWFKQINIGEKS